jgi:hypothetical protein
MKSPTKGLWLVQLLEYAIGLSLGMSATRAQKPLAIAVCAVLILLNAACVMGPLSAFRVLSASTHRIAGYSIALCAILVAMLAPLDITSRLTLFVTAVAEGFISVRFGHGFRTTSTRPQ